MKKYFNFCVRKAKIRWLNQHPNKNIQNYSKIMKCRNKNAKIAIKKCKNTKS